jgi:hypothetical protein
LLICKACSIFVGYNQINRLGVFFVCLIRKGKLLDNKQISKTMKKIILVALISALAAFVFSCAKTDTQEQIYTEYYVEYFLENNIKNKSKRFIVTYRNPEFANRVTESYEEIENDTLWFRFEAKSLDYLYFAGLTMNDTADFNISIYVDSELIKKDSAYCDWACDSAFIELEYPLP